MSANKKRRRLPEEDLAAAVADIISSPITRSNLSFLRPLPTLPPEAPALGSSIKADTEPAGHSPAPLGSASQPMGFTQDAEVLNLPSSAGHFQKPMGDPANPAGFGERLPFRLWQPVSPNRTLWQAEGLGTFFEQTRVRRIHQAQDALSLVEEKVYDLLWGAKNQRRDEFRLVHYSLQRIATEARINIKTVRDLIPRLIEKGFIAIEHEADVRRNIPTLYRVSSYATVLHDQKRRNRSYVAKTGKGVFYVHPITASVEAASDPVGVDLYPGGFIPMGPGSPPLGDITEPQGPAPIGAMGRSGLKPMGSSGQLSLDNLIDSFVRQTTTTTYSAIIDSIREALSLEPDDTLLKGMIYACHQNAFATIQGSATDEELIYFTTAKARVLSRAPNIRNHLAVLRKAVPECFLGETFRAYRAASVARKHKAAEDERRVEQERLALEQETAETEARYKLWAIISQRHKGERGYDMRAIASDPELDDVGKQRAQAMLERLGRFTRCEL